MAKLSKAQIDALKVASYGPIEVSFFGGERMSSLPTGIRSMSTLYSLSWKGPGKACLSATQKGRSIRVYALTDAGREALDGALGV